MLRAKLYRLARSSERLRSRMMASGILESAGGSFVSTVHPNRNEKCGAGHCTKSKTGRIYAKRFGDLVPVAPHGNEASEHQKRTEY